MEPIDEQNRPYPAGYEHTERRVADTIGRMRQIDRQIENLPPTSKPSPAPPPPPGMVRTPRFMNRERQADFLKNEKETLKAATWQAVEKDTRDAGDPAGRVVRDRARETLFPNPYRRMSQEDRATESRQPKDIEKAQDLMDAVRLDKAAERQQALQPEDRAVGSLDQRSTTMADRFSSTLKFVKMMENVGDMVKEKLSREPDKKEPEKEKE